MAALETLVEAEERKKPLSPQDLLAVFDQLGKGVKLTPEMLRVILEVSSFDPSYPICLPFTRLISSFQDMITAARGTKPTPQELAPAQRLLASGGPVSPADAVRAISKATVQVRQSSFVLKAVRKLGFLEFAETRTEDGCAGTVHEFLPGHGGDQTE